MKKSFPATKGAKWANSQMYNSICRGLIKPDTFLGGDITTIKRCSMTNIRRSFTTDFKLEAAQLVTEQGYSFAEASRSLGIGETALRRWVS
jgi:hypothetical protein